MRNSEVKLLDCTLRDGGYINNWRFGLLTIRSIISRLDNAGIDIIECGFLDSRESYDKDRSIFPDMPSIAKTLAHSRPKRASLVAMIDYGTFDEESLIPQSECILDGIRLIFKKESVDEALTYARKIKALGYQLFLNPVALTSYRDLELLQLIEKINEIHPYGMSIVDTYGLMFSKEIEKYIYIIDSNLRDDIVLGYHAHNNLQMANANCFSYINKMLARTIVVDSTVFGMGKNAGNACTELICSYVEKNAYKSIDLSHVVECGYTDILKFGTKAKWGYSLDTFLSAIHDCSPNWIKFYMGKNTLSIKGIRTILDELPFEKREISYFSKELAEEKYIAYLNDHVEDSGARKALRERVDGRAVLLLCPGKTLATHRADIDKFIHSRNPVVFTVNFFTDMIKSDYAFLCNPYRYAQMQGIFPELANPPQVLITSNITPSDTAKPDLTFNYISLYEKAEGDNSAALLIWLLHDLGVSNIAIAGMDGFDETNLSNSFFDDTLHLSSGETANLDLIRQLQQIFDANISLFWITPSQVNEKALRTRS